MDQPQSQMPQDMEPREQAVTPWLLWTLVVVILAGIGYFSWYLWSQTQTKTAVPVATTKTTTTTTTTKPATTTTTATVSTADWKTYTNDTYGFSFKYPKDWTVKKVDGDTLLSLIANSLENAKNRVDGTDLPSTMTVNLYSNLSKLDAKASSLKGYLDSKAALTDPVYTNVKAFNFGNKTGYQATMGPNQFGGGRIFYVQLSDGSILNAWFFEKDKDTSAAESEKILSTFQFTK